ncbi:MAG: hypothetical protein KC478_00680 [Bacteriovoracaceae bacterium]|nr:hypothetical protein [Bacteriovoracaceae bacterium]
MRLLQLIITLIFISSCRDVDQKSSSYLHDKFLSVYEVIELNERLVNANELKLAPGAWHSAMRLKARVNNFKTIDYCLLVKTPYEVEPGELKFVQAASDTKCSEYFFSPAIAQALSFYNLKINYADYALSLRLDKKSYDYKFKNIQSKALEISLGSLEYQGTPDRVLADGVICKKVEDDCSVSLDQCNLCENGHYYVKNGHCSSSYSKVCGIDNCGAKGEPACIRGEVATGVKDYCIQDSPVGFCSGSARVACVNKLLICE